MSGSNRQHEVCAGMAAVGACECGDGARGMHDAAGAAPAERGLAMDRLVAVDGMDAGTGAGSVGDEGLSDAHGAWEREAGAGQVVGSAGV